MADHGVNWTAIAYSALQETAQSTEMRVPTRSRRSPTTRSCGRSARRRRLGLKVCLKPVVNVRRRHLARPHRVLRPGRAGRADVGRVVRLVPRVHPARGRASPRPRAARCSASGARWCAPTPARPSGASLVAEVRAGVLRPRDLQLRQVPGGPPRAGGTRSTSSRPAATTRSTRWEAQLDRIERAVAAHGKPFFFMEAGCPCRERLAGSPQRLVAAGCPFGRRAAALLRGDVRRVRRAALGARLHAVGLAAPALRRSRTRGATTTTTARTASPPASSSARRTACARARRGRRSCHDRAHGDRGIRGGPDRWSIVVGRHDGRRRLARGEQLRRGRGRRAPASARARPTLREEGATAA